MKESQEYVPGVCNIDFKGRKKRALFGSIIIIVSLFIWLFLITFNISAYWQFLLVIPLWLGFNGLWQARLSFCVGNAARHQFEIRNKTVKITNDKNIAKDKRRAMQINMYSLACAILLTIVLFIISITLR